MSSLPVPPFEVVPPSEAARRMPTRRQRRNWKPVIDALVAGRSLFMADEDVSDGNVKYLMLVLYRRGKGEKLRTTRVRRSGGDGRLLWVEQVAVPSVTAG